VTDEFRTEVRNLRPRRGRFASLLIGVGALALAVAAAWIAFAPPHSSPLARRRALSSAPSIAQEEAPEWLDESAAESGKNGATSAGRRHRDEEGRQKAAKPRNRLGIEGPADTHDPHMNREAAREAAANAGILGVLKSQVGEVPAMRKQPLSAAPSSDPMSALGALMGDLVGSNFGFGRGGSGYGGGESGLRSLGLSGARLAGARKPTDDDGRENDWPRWRKAEPSRQPNHEAPLAAAHEALLTRELATRLRPRTAQPKTPVRADTPRPPPPSNAAEELLARYTTLDGVQFIDANDYFANTYVPGDPELRSLQARLRGYDRASLLPQNLRAARLDERGQRVVQPFDAPGQAALAVYVSASERGLTSARRMLVQVGLRATPRYSGRRPTMNIGIVLDAREALDPTVSANVRALLAAFADARDPSDRFALFAAGPGGGQLVAADAFRHGPVSVALQRLQTERSGTSVSMPDALQAALQSVRGSDDPNSPLGSSVTIVIAPRAFGDEFAQLESLAQASAVEGIPLSAFGAGPEANPDQLSRLALAGQGNHRMLDAAEGAAQAVDRELSAVARVVARAVRLRIRLASGARLVSVLGSHPFDAVHAERVREAENSIDQRLRRNLGIAQDRGEDEEGVQIVIPSFYAGDSHVVLLDVVAEGPGPIADVSVRYKDLVQLRNGTARESLWLPNLELARGALQRNVLKNLVAYELASRLRSAGDALASGADSARARRELDLALALLDSMGVTVPELRGDGELETDRALTAEYLPLLEHIQAPAQRQFVADSLHFASLMKLQPRPE
jgi:hypothetical protein